MTFRRTEFAAAARWEDCMRAGVAIVLALACVACSDPIAAPSSSSKAGGLDFKRLAELRAIGEGCAMSFRDSTGALHGVALPRKILPFPLPAVHRDATGRGNGQVSQVVVNANGRSIMLNCVVPSTLTPEQFFSSFERSRAAAQWKEVISQLDDSPTLPELSERKPLTPEALQIRDETMGLRSSAPPGSYGPAPRYTEEGCNAELSRVPSSERGSGQRPSFDCWSDCGGWSIDIWSDGSNWHFHVTFYACGTGAGGGGYWWLVDNGYLTCSGYYHDPDHVGGVVIYDDRDALIQQYRTRGANYVPGCFDFELMPSTANFSYDQIRSHDRWYNHAIFRNVLAGGLEALYADTAFTINPGAEGNRVYSSPDHQATVSPRVPNGRHIYGDAADIHATSSGWQPLRNRAANLNPQPCAEPLSISTYDHVHLDYRTVPGALNRQDSCPTGWTLP